MNVTIMVDCEERWGELDMRISIIIDPHKTSGIQS